MYFLAAVDSLSKFPTACIFDKANGRNVTNVLDMKIEKYGLPRSIQLDKAKCLVEHQVRNSVI